MADIIARIENLHKSFGDQHVLRGISIDVEEQENLVVFGQSGTGKSVLLKCMVRLLIPEQGRIIIDGLPVLDLKERELNELRKRMGFLFQGAALYDSMSVRDNLEFPLRKNFKMAPEVINRKVRRALDLVSLGDAIDKMPAELSGGMRKRIGLARSIITDPMLMLYDEPTTGLDPITSKEISKLILTLQKELKMTAVVVTHDIICAEIVSDRTIVLKDGNIKYEGDIHELSQSDDPFLRNFFSRELI